MTQKTLLPYWKQVLQADSPQSNRFKKRTLTGIPGLDELFEGGIPSGRLLLVLGEPGTGKTVLLSHFLYEGVLSYKENAVFVTAEESREELTDNLASFGWDLQALEKKKRLAFVDLSRSLHSEIATDEDYDLDPLIERTLHAIEKVQAKRVAFDGLDLLFDRFSNREAVRDAFHRLSRTLASMGITSMVSMQAVEDQPAFARRVAEYAASGVLKLNMNPGEQQIVRRLGISKLRGMGYRSGEVTYEITADGIRVYPKIPMNRHRAKTSFRVKRRFGNPALDKLLAGGIPQGHVVMLTGQTGTGKTTLSMSFINEGLSKGERCLYVALEEPIAQIKKTAHALGCPLAQYEEDGLLNFISSPLIDITIDRLLYDIVDAALAHKSSRIVIDSISTLLSENVQDEKVRQFLLQLTGFAKSQGITCLLTALNPDGTSAAERLLPSANQARQMRLSSVCDGIISLAYEKQDRFMKKILTIIKMRGCNHSREIISYELGSTGLIIEK